MIILTKKGYPLDKITGDESFNTPIIFLLFCAMLFISDTNTILKDIVNSKSIMISSPIFFTGNTFETLIRFVWFLIPITIIFKAIKENNLLLKSSFVLGSISLFLTAPVINKVGIESLYTIRVLLLFVSITFVMKYLITTINRYKKAIKEKR